MMMFMNVSIYDTQRNENYAQTQIFLNIWALRVVPEVFLRKLSICYKSVTGMYVRTYDTGHRNFYYSSRMMISILCVACQACLVYD
jgi:hypothetical protein